LNSQPEANIDYEVKSISFNLFNHPRLALNWDEVNSLHYPDTVAIGCYVWGHPQSTSLIKWLRSERPECTIIAGGYQISDILEENQKLYPGVDHFIHGTGEHALYELIVGRKKDLQINNLALPGNSFSKVYSNNTIPLSRSGLNVRMETKRNCPFNCSFCSYQTGMGRKTITCEMELIKAELNAITNSDPNKINITDPVFNMGETYLPFLEEFRKLNSSAIINVQVRPELVQKAKKEGNNRFLELSSQLNLQLELGLQTIQQNEMDIVGRKNDMKLVNQTLENLDQYNINYGISLIYGLPGQTLHSFENTIKTLKQNCKGQLVAYPLMLLQGTKLYRNQKEYGLKEEAMGEYNLTYVTESFSFSREEYFDMVLMAEELNPHSRLF
jgi:radical SAM superfamily enzyme YgiQ (UPF0313 family)